MNYPVRCTNVITQLKNCKRYEHAHFYKIEEAMYIDVRTSKEATLIARFNGLMEDALKTYQEILNNN